MAAPCPSGRNLTPEALDALNQDTEPWLADDAEVDDLLRAHVAEARENAGLYVELMLAYEGHEVVPHGIHVLMRDALDVCRRAGKHCVIVMPPEHGKSSQIAKWLVWQLGQEPSLRIGLVSGDEDLAKRNLILTRKTILSVMNRCIFPQLVPDTKASKTGGEWSKERLYLQNMHAPCFEVFALDGNAEGVRLDVIWLDDAVTRKCHRSQAERERARSAIHGTWLSRVTRGGLCIFTNNVWHRDDAIHRMLESPSFMVLWVGYAETDHFYWRVHHPAEGWEHGEEGTLELWPCWDKARLEARRAEDRLTFKRLYNQKALLAEDTRFPPADQWHTYTPEELPQPGSGERLYAFLDPSGGKMVEREDYAALAVVMMGRDRQGFLIDCWIVRAIPEDQVAIGWEMHKKWKRRGYEGLHLLAVEMLPKDEQWLRGPFMRHQQELKEAGDPDWKLDWTIRNPRIHKNTRIEKINPHIRNGWLKFPEGFQKLALSGTQKGEHWARMVSMMEDFPFADHDDGPDSLSGAVEIAEAMGPAGGAEGRRERIEQLRREQEEARRNLLRPRGLDGREIRPGARKRPRSLV